MAKMKNKKNNMSSRSPQGRAQFEAGEEYGGEEREVGVEAASQGSERNQGSRETPARRSQGQSQDFDPRQLLDSARDFIEGHPGRATLIGAVIGGAVAGLFASERGRSLISAAYSYSRPMIADYARNFVSGQSSDLVDRALPQ